jgi:adenosylcobinamide-phosphate synthase
MKQLSTVELALIALMLEAAIGYPALLYRAIGHPVTWMGALLAWLEARLNRLDDALPQRRGAGIVALATLLGVTGGVSAVLVRLLDFGLPGAVLLVLAATSLLAQRSLHGHVRAVADALERDGLDGGRAAVAMIVGRNPLHLDEAGVARAAIESLAENFADGVVAPAFWLALGGLPGGAIYKAINTADSMIGHRTPRYAWFGWAAARLDDVVNLPASRIAALLIAVGALAAGGSTTGGSTTGGSATGAWRAVWRDASRHRSPNAGWPEAAMAGALGLQLAGPRIYGDERVEDAFMGDGNAAATVADIRRALLLYRAACVTLWLVLLAIVLVARA